MQVKNPKLEGRKQLLKKLREHAVMLDEMVVRQRKIAFERQVETFLPMTAALVAGVFLLVALGVQMVRFIYPENLEVTPLPQVVEVVEEELVESDLGGVVVKDAVEIGRGGEVEILQGDEVVRQVVEAEGAERDFLAEELPVARIFGDVEELGTVVKSEQYLLVEAVELMEEMKDLIILNTREQVLTLDEGVRRVYLSAQLVEMERVLDEGRAMYLVLEKKRVDLEGVYAERERQYEEWAAMYAQGLEEFEGQEVEQLVAEMRLAQADLGALNEDYLALGDVMVGLENHYEVLEQKRVAVEANVEALVAGVQVTLFESIDLGLILQ